MIDDPPPRDPVPHDPWQHTATYPRGLLTVLAMTMIVSLVAAIVLGLRLTDERETAADLRALSEQQQEALEALRAGLRADRTPLEAIQAAVEEIRGLAFTSPVRPQVLTSAELAERVREAFDEGTPRAEFERTQKVLEAFGLVAPGEDIYGLLATSQEEQVGGFYDTETKELVVEGQEASQPTPLDQLLLAHELTHALTDQHFGLSRLDTLVEQGRDDEATAFQSLAEGDAQLVAQLYTSAVLTEDEQRRLSQQALSISTEEFEQLPPFLQEGILFSYTSGLTFVQALHRQGGFAAIDAAYRDPPTSTEQILHPSRYITDRDEPQRVTLPSVGAALGEGWTRFDRGQIGELDLRLIADHGGANYPAADARAAAAGWDGGTYGAFESRAGVAVAVLTVFDSEAEAREAVSLFGRWLPMRFRNVGGSFVVGAGNRGWDSGEGAGVVVRDGDRMGLVLGPDRATVERARRAFGSS